MTNPFNKNWWPVVRIIIHAAIAFSAVYFIVIHEDGSTEELQSDNIECSTPPASQSEDAVRLRQHLTINMPQCALYLDEDFK